MRDNYPEKDDLLKLNGWEMYPLIIKAYDIFNEDVESLRTVFKLLEVIIFRDKLANTRADLATRLNPVLKNFKDLITLKNGIAGIYKNVPYWNDDNLEQSLKSIYNSPKNAIVPYILEKYENYLRQGDKAKKGYIFKIDENLTDAAREHIAPQTENDEKVSSGYCEYDPEFMSLYLNNIGNLVLITQSHNSSNGNKPFAEKLETFNDNLELLQQREIKDFMEENKTWTKKSIDKRFEKIRNFIFDRWNVENIL